MDPDSPESMDIHYPCLDLFPIKGGLGEGVDQHSESGILLEVWKAGGTFHTSLPLAEGSAVELAPFGPVIRGQVSECQPDGKYGFVVTVLVSPDQRDQWFPESYRPPRMDDTAPGEEPLLPLSPTDNS